MADLDDGTVDEVCVGHGAPLVMGNGAEGDRSEAACLLGPRHPIGACGDLAGEAHCHQLGAVMGKAVDAARSEAACSLGPRNPIGACGEVARVAR